MSLSRVVSNPSPDPSDYVLPVEQGGLGVTNQAQVVLEFGLVPNASKGTNYGPVELDINGKIPLSVFGSLVTGNPISIKAVSSVPAGSEFSILITNFDSDRIYNPTITGDGTVFMEGRTVKVKAPSTAGAFTVSLLGKSFSFTAT